ncbi:MAG TPA: enoyl-CoA hydratase-related protein [Spirochaetia bacterium]|nr:enoyl-CoA hydratase-related protein [Spirochaetia bacterium]
MRNTVLLEISEGVAVVTMNRPAALNALNDELGRELLEALQECGDDSVRAVVLTGSGRAFCAGGDLRFFLQYADGDPGRPFRELAGGLNETIIALRTLAKPVIAAVNGATGGAGISLACACDLRFAAASAVFRQAYTAAGLTPDGAWTLLVPLLTGLGRAAELLFLNPVLSARDALGYGLVNRVLEDGELLEHSLATARQLAAGPTQAFARAKELLNRALLVGLHAQLELEKEGITASACTADYLEGLAAFLGKRLPVFQGR